MTALIITALAVAAGGGLAAWFAARRRVDVPCTLELEATPEHFHAHAELDGVAVREGDEVLVHGAPRRIAHGERRTVRTDATVHRASAPRRLWTRLVGASGVTELYEVGFEG